MQTTDLSGRSPFAENAPLEGQCATHCNSTGTALQHISFSRLRATSNATVVVIQARHSPSGCHTMNFPRLTWMVSGVEECAGGAAAIMARQAEVS